MKIFKFALGSMLIALVSTFIFASSAKAQTTQYYTFTGSAFVMGTTPSTPINTSGNWTNVASDPSPIICNGGSFLCGFKVVIEPGKTATLQQLIDRIKDVYDASGTPPTLSHNQTITLTNGSGALVATITVYLKS